MLAGHYDPQLVALSVVIAVVASFVALDMTALLVAARGRRSAFYRLTAGAVAMGSGIWAMHFVGMLAFSLPIPLAYDVRTTLASLGVAVAASAVALHAVGRSAPGPYRLAGAGTLLGLGIAAMHYLGMEALQMRPRIAYDPPLVLLSVLFAIAAANAALWICLRLRHETLQSGLRQRLASALVMGAAIAGMHYTGMASANFAAGSVCGAVAQGLGTGWLAAAIAGVVAVVPLALLLGSAYRALRPTVRSRLVFLVLSCALPLSLLTLLFVGIDYQQRREQQFGELLHTARALSATVDKDLASVETGLNVLATSPDLASGDYAAFYAQARAALEHLSASAITLNEASGPLLLDTRRPYGELLPWFENAEHARRIFETGRPAISDHFVGQLDTEPLILVGVPVRRRGSVYFQLNASVRSERLSALLHRQQLQPDWIVTVLDSRGRVIARSREMARFVGAKGPSAVLAALAGRSEGWVDAVTLEGIPVVTVFSRSDSSNWTVTIGVPRSSVNAPLRDALAWLLAGFALLLGLSLLLAWRIGGTIAGALRALTGPALALGAGAPVAVPALGLTEADEVGRALNQAAGLLGAARHDAQHDALTGLANRALFNEVLQQQLAITLRNGDCLAVLYVDLDGFKAVNDNFGHAAGDELLRQVAQRLLQSLRACDIVARLGGDEFVVALVQTSAEGAAQVAAKLIELLTQPYAHNGRAMRVSASIGAALFPADAGDPQGLVARADAAMYAAKKSGKGRYVLAAA